MTFNARGATMQSVLSSVAAGLMAIAIGTGTAFAADDHKTDRQKDRASAEYKAAVKQAEADYKTAKKRCDGMKGNEKDVCAKEAKAAEKKAKADAKARRDSMSARAEAGDQKREADRSVAKEKCDSLSGDAKDACQRQAKARSK
jgi:hypothetical protein